MSRWSTFGRRPANRAQTTFAVAQIELTAERSCRDPTTATPARLTTKHHMQGAIVPSTTAIRTVGVLLATALSCAVVATASAQPGGPGPGNAPNAKLCQKGGWQHLATADGAAFASQGACVSYAAKGGTLMPYPSATPRERFQDICASAGGVFSEGLTYWRCSSSNGLTPSTLTELREPCEAADRIALYFPFDPPYTIVDCTELPILPPPPPM